MSSEQETKTTEESSVGGNLDAAGSAAGSGSVGVDASSKKSEEKRKPKKLGQKSAESTPAKGDNQEKIEANGEVNGDAPAPETPKKMDNQSRSKSRQGSRTRGRGSSQPPSDTDSAYRSDVSQKGKRNRNRNRGKAQAQSQAESGGGGGGGPLGAVDEVGETLDGVTDGVGGLVDDTAGKALSKPTEALGGLLGNKKKGGQKGGQKGEEGEDEEEDAGTNEQLRLRLDLNLDIEVQLKAKIHGDLTLGLLYVVQQSTCSKANVSQELVHDPMLLLFFLCATYTPARTQPALQRKNVWRSSMHLCSGSLLSPGDELFRDCFMELILICNGLHLEMASLLCNKMTISQIIIRFEEKIQGMVPLDCPPSRIWSRPSRDHRKSLAGENNLLESPVTFRTMTDDPSGQATSVNAMP